MSQKALRRASRKGLTVLASRKEGLSAASGLLLQAREELEMIRERSACRSGTNKSRAESEQMLVRRKSAALRSAVAIMAAVPFSWKQLP